MRLARLLCVFVISLIVTLSAPAQNLGTGLYAFGSFDSKGFDTINLGNLNTHFEIPIINKQGRGGTNFVYTMAYDGLIWNAVTTSGVQSWTPDPSWGFHGQFLGTGLTGYMTNSEESFGSCELDNHHILGSKVYDFVYHDAFGRNHAFNYSVSVCGTGAETITGNGSSSDGSGLYWVSGKVYTRNGSTIYAPSYTGSGTSMSGGYTDTNGNEITDNGNGTYTDTLGATALTIAGSGTPSSPMTFTYPVAKQSNSATTSAVITYYKAYTVQTNFGCSGITEYGATSVNLVDHITLPDASGSTYSFTYEPTIGGVSGAVTGRLASVTLPTGGVISYTYQDGGCNGTSGMNQDGTVGSLTRTTTDGVRTYVRAPVPGTGNATSTTLQDEKGNQTKYTFSSIVGVFYETHRQAYQGAVGGTPLFEQFTCYNGAQPSCDGAAVAPPFSETTALSSYNGGTQLTTTNFYDAYGMLTASTQSAGSTTLKSTSNTYTAAEALSASNVTDGQGNVISYTTYGYDETTPTSTATLGIPQHVAATGTRSNQTSVHVQLASGAITTTTTYYDTGAPIAVTTPNGTTSYAYDSTQTFATSTTLPTPSSGVALATSAAYDQNSGALLSTTGMNANQTTQITQYDSLLRPTVATLPNGGQVTATYSPTEVGIFQTLSGTETAQTYTLLDSYGRTSRAAVYNGQSSNPWYQVDYCYDATGLLQFQTVKYQANGFASAKQCSGNGTTYAYDGLGRVTSSTNSDGTTTYVYTGRAVETTDVNGIQKITQYDMLGRISGVCEVNSYGTVIGSGATVACGMDIAGTGYTTTYAYSGNSTIITQGAQTRTFTTDWAGRTTYTGEPERGPTNYSYAYNGTGLQVTRTRPQANQTNPNVLTTTITQYDSLSRPVSVTYNDGLTPNKFYNYDSSIGWNFTQSNIKGQMTDAIANNTATTAFSYDSMGRVIAMASCEPSTCGNAAAARPNRSFSYDWAGNLISEGDADSGVIAYGRSPAGEVTSITNQSYSPTNLASNVVNGPFGVISYSLGNGLSAFKRYDNLGRLNGTFLCAGPAAVFCQGATQVYGSTNAMKGSQVQNTADTVTGQITNYGYDQFNRLSTTAVTQGTVQNFWYVIDRYGNRWQQNVTAGTGPSPSIAFNAINNQITTGGYAYDYPGNMTSDGVHTYTYDAEGNITQVDGGSTATYVYDALNRRVRVQTASSTNEYLFDYAGRPTSTWQASNNAALEGRIYWDGRQIAYRPASGGTYFNHQDVLGTERLRTDPSGNVVATYQSLPWGDGYTPSVQENSWDKNNLHFAQLDHDTESNTDHAQFRQYSSAQGRWLSPDPYDGSYHFRNPQSFNRYTYAMNRPLSGVDPSGLMDSDVCDDPSIVCFDGGDGPPAGGDGGAGNGPTCIANCSGTDPNPGDNNPPTNPNPPDDPNPGSGGSAGCPPNCGFTMTVTYHVGAPSNTSNESSVADHWPLNGNLLPLTPRGQDGVCTTGRLSNAMNSDPAVLSCCKAHDNCYAAHGCNATSWIPSPLSGGSCTMCNITAASCISGAFF
jgi:RHS repeat-associated protein